MYKMRKIFVFIGLLVLLAVVFSTNTTALTQVKANQSKNDFSVEKINSSPFIQPHTISFTSLQGKGNNNNPIVRWYAAIVVLKPLIKKQLTTHSFSDQTISRSEKISILLFPFHFFW